jgi:hypothetical protein
MQGRLLGAEQADAQDWVAVHQQDIATATARQRGLAATVDSLLTSAITELAPITTRLEAAYPDIRQRMLADGFPADVVTSSNLSADQAAALDILARSTEVAYPTGDLIASLRDAARALANFVDTLTLPA